MLKYPKTRAARHKCLWPAPVYEAHCDDGTIRRWSFWCPMNASDDLAMAYGRKIAQGFLSPSPWDENPLPGETRRKVYPKIVAGYVDLGERRLRDHFGAVKPKRVRVSKAEWQATLRNLLAHTDNPPDGIIREAERLLAA